MMSMLYIKTAIHQFSTHENNININHLLLVITGTVKFISILQAKHYLRNAATNYLLISCMIFFVCLVFPYNVLE